MFSALKNLVKIGAPLAVFAFASVANAQAPAYVRIRSISYAGSGCPANSVSQNVANDLRAFTLLFDSYIAEVGPGIPLSQSRKNCQIAVDLDFPQGWSYTVATFDYRGYANLEAGVTGNQSAAYYFQGSSATARLGTNFYGPAARDYQLRDTLGITALVWSPCGLSRALNINTQVRLSGQAGRRGMLTTDSIDGSVHHVYGIQWQRCR